LQLARDLSQIPNLLLRVGLHMLQKLRHTLMKARNRCAPLPIFPDSRLSHFLTLLKRPCDLRVAVLAERRLTLLFKLFELALQGSTQLFVLAFEAPQSRIPKH
jgi:hypothetical protein